MPMRKNAGLGMARVLNLVDKIALSHAPDAVGAAGHIDVFLNSRNVIPGKVVFTVDFRSPDLAVSQDMEARLKSGAQATTPAGSTALRPPQWSCARAWMGSVTMKQKKSVKTGPPQGQTCCSKLLSKRRSSRLAPPGHRLEWSKEMKFTSPLSPLRRLVLLRPVAAMMTAC